MDEFHAMALEESVNKLFRKEWFDICTLDDIIKLSGVTPNHTVYQQLRAFHCKHYSDMSPKLKQLIEQKVVECLKGDYHLNPARVVRVLTDEGQNFAFTEDRYLDAPN